MKEVGCNLDADLYIATDLRQNKSVFVKLLEKEKCLFYSELKSGMQKEADIFGKCKSDVITPFREVVETPDYIAEILEYIPGERFFSYIQDNGAVSEETALRFANEMIESLRCMEDAGLPYAHGFIGPNSFIVKPDGNVSLISTGIIERASRLASSKKMYYDDCLAEYALNQFEAPETARTTLYWTPNEPFKKLVDEKSDVYSIGALLYYMLTGADLSAASFEFEPIRQINPNLSSRFEQVVARCTKTSPEERYKTLSELDNALNRCKNRRRPSSNIIAKAIRLCET